MDNHSGDFANLEIWGLCKVISHLVPYFKKAVGRPFLKNFSTMAFPKELVVDLLRSALRHGFIPPRQALALLSANMMDHPESGRDQFCYLRNAISLYNAKTLQDIWDAEEISSGDFRNLVIGFMYETTPGSHSDKMNRIIEDCYLRDIIKVRHFYEDVLVDWQLGLEEIQDILSEYTPLADAPTSRKELGTDGGLSQTTSAFPVSAITATLQQLKADGRISETQCGLMLCYILHAMDKRKSDGACYVDHPMAVAGYVQKHGLEILGSEEQVWKASLVALLHDIGEENPALDLANDLKGLLPDDVLDAVCLLHKKEEKSYFKYINQIATNPLAAFVKLCDLRHNSDGTGPTQDKQTYVYSLAAAYLQEMIVYPHKAGHIEIAAFAQTKIGYTENEFAGINALANKEDSGVLPEESKCPAVTDNIFANLKQRIEQEARLDANTRRNEISPVLA